MSQWRKDPVTDRWVIIAPERKKRPSDFKTGIEDSGKDNCPLCPGHEKETPPEIFACGIPRRQPDTPGWKVRVVPNKFPALREQPSEEGTTDRFAWKTGLGRHEIVIETPHHVSCLGSQSPGQLSVVIHAWHERYCRLKSDERWRYIQIFKNVGRAAGASLEHSHSQIIAIPFIPSEITRELEGSVSYRRTTGRCVFCDVLSRELEKKQRIVYNGHGFIAFTPFASRFPCEVWVVPREHTADFGELEERRQQADLAEALHTVLQGLGRALENPPYNLILHTAPLEGSDAADFHWHLEILPRVTAVAGFELGTGIYINPVPPEEAAAWIRRGIIEGGMDDDS